MRLDIRLQREIARLHYYAPQSARAIAKAVGVSPTTVRILRNKLIAAHRPWAELEALDDEAWCHALGTRDHTHARRKPAPDWNWVHTEMLRPEATLEQLWREWKERQPDGILYAQFTAEYRRWKGQLKVTLRRLHLPGDKQFADFAGRRIRIDDPALPEPRYAHLFVSALGYSSMTYLEAVWTQNARDWASAMMNAFEAYGGVPNWVVSDNLKAAVLRRERDEVLLNPVYRDCLGHYGTAALPIGPRKPRQNAKAEAGVQVAQRWVLFALRDRVFHSLEECNAEIRRLTAELNRRPFKKMEGCRLSRFVTVERAALKPLPATRFELCDWRYRVRVGEDYLVEHARCFYSVPYQYRGEQVDLRITARALEVFHRGKRLATHALQDTPGTISRLAEHMPVAHRRVLEGEPQALLAWAGSVGAQTRAMIGHHLLERQDRTNGLKAARRLRELARLHGEERFEAVCAYALRLNMTALRSVESILKSKADLKVRGEPAPPPRRDHENLRGAAYFGGE